MSVSRPTKAEIRKRAELREFLEVCGDQPISAYRQEDVSNDDLRLIPKTI